MMQAADQEHSLDEQYKNLYTFFDADLKDTLLFTSSGQEAINQVFDSAYQELTVNKGRNQFAVELTSEASAILCADKLQEHYGCVHKCIKVKADGKVTLDAVIDALTPRTALVSLSWANGLTGVVQDVVAIGEVLQDRGVAFHVDATHAWGKSYYKREDFSMNYISINGPPLHAPLATGALYAREGSFLAPFILGGDEQAALRAGAINPLLSLGFCAAAKEVKEAEDFMVTEIARLKKYFEDSLRKLIPEVEILCAKSPRVPHIFAASFKGVSNEALLYHLQQKKIYASMGGGSMQNITHLLKSMGYPKEIAISALSFSLNRTNTRQEIDYTCEALKEAYTHLRRLNV